MTARRASAFILIAVLAAAGVHAQSGAAIPRQVEYATVEVVGFARSGAGYEAVGWGSGALVDAGGLVLTAFHVVGDLPTGRLLNAEGLAGIAMVQAPGTAPVPLYLGKVTSYSVGLDLALIDVYARLDGTTLPAYTFFPALALPGLLDRAPVVGDGLTAYGFVTGFNQPLTAVPGTLSQYAIVPGFGGKPMVISTTAAYGTALSGGPVFNASGALSGVVVGRTMLGSSAVGVVRPWEEIRAWATGQLTQTNRPVQVVVAGRIVDGSTLRPLSRAAFYILRPNVTSEEFLANPTDADVMARAGADRNGAFVTDPPVPFGAAYNMVVYADGYGLVYTTQPILLDDRACPAKPRCEFGVIEMESLQR